jgi:hypothetical protein
VTRRHRLGAASLLTVGVLLLSGCVQPGTLANELVACRQGEDGKPANGVVLMAQAVRTASWVPCLRGVPLGWYVSDVDVRNDRAQFWLDSDLNGIHAIGVRLTASCDTTGATRINSDREQMERFERVTQVSPRFVGTRFYVFTGGCITMLFKLSGENRAEPLAVATVGIGTVSRADLREQVREQSGGRLELDPVSGDGP